MLSNDPFFKPVDYLDIFPRRPLTPEIRKMCEDLSDFVEQVLHHRRLLDMTNYLEEPQRSNIREKIELKMREVQNG